MTDDVEVVARAMELLRNTMAVITPEPGEPVLHTLDRAIARVREEINLKCKQDSVLSHSEASEEITRAAMSADPRVKVLEEALEKVLKVEPGAKCCGKGVGKIDRRGEPYEECCGSPDYDFYSAFQETREIVRTALSRSRGGEK